MHPLKKLLTTCYDIQNTITVSCSPRSGSTWLSERLISIGKLDCVDEPLRLEKGRDDPLYHLGLRARTCLIDADQNRIDSVKSIMNEVLYGRVGYLELYPRLQRRLLLKFVRINRMLGWATREFNLRYNVLLLRHPCAVISSQLLMHGGNTAWFTVSKPAPDIPKYIEDKVNELSNGKAHRTLAINWALDQRIPLFDDRPKNILLVFYEDLIINPEQELSRICNFCNLKFRRIPDKASATASADFSREKQISKWKNQLTPSIAEDIVMTCQKLGIDFYTTDALPKKHYLPKKNATVDG